MAQRPEGTPEGQLAAPSSRYAQVQYGARQETRCIAQPCAASWRAMSRWSAAGCARFSPRRVLALLLGAALRSSAAADVPPATLGWAHGADASLAGQSCTVDRRSASELSQHEFDALYLEKQPVVLTGLVGNERVRELCARERLLADWVRRGASRRRAAA